MLLCTASMSAGCLESSSTSQCYHLPHTGHLSILCCSSANDGSSMGISLEQALPLHPSWLNFNRLRLRLEQPVQMGPLTLQLRGKAGSVYGDLPPYEAFPLGGTNSVRGYAEGGVGSGRHFVEGTAELRWVLC
jgi:outer membrane protein insertion porin family